MNTPAHSHPISGLILAGGLARRMGGLDKGLADYRARPMIVSVLERLRPQVSEVLINANRHQTQYAAFGHPVISDHITDFAGPLAGIAAGMRASRHALLLCVPCDAPLLAADLAPRLLAALLETDAEIAVASSAGQTQPVFCLCRTQLLPGLQQFLQQGGRKVDHWQNSIKCVHVRFDDASAFCNINTLDELEALAASDTYRAETGSSP
ncbi:molybdenum cofactor guanylyltransferase [Pseudomethylobacillus aquaticus]|uniref:Molybdenum cofactor guanylyltransferase n=1 Tax=Pseudomethylobacillus aquaticus TaxID=2676064 RepID=A0A3N0UV67_9PROT|nr:molybdenum cofactor guanylyltransferase MobA [Pseudomethylobacillus aquaticus]ROH84101.1 molybdenum cofactor guanylyltransferase [Pseudomethylobacillus aquaticus]